jgi:hypothetical protein
MSLVAKLWDGLRASYTKLVVAELNNYGAWSAPRASSREEKHKSKGRCIWCLSCLAQTSAYPANRWRAADDGP